MATLTEQHLAQADQHLAEAEERVTRQRALIEELAANGHATAEAEALLTTIMASLDAMRAHRATLLAESAAAEAG